MNKSWEEEMEGKVPNEIHSDVRTFLLPTEDMCLHIITTGFSQRQRFLVVMEDAYQKDLGKTELLSKREIKEKFNIIL